MVISEIQMTILGSFLSFLFTLNAYLARKTLEKINEIELKLAVLISRHNNNEERFKDNDIDIKNEIKNLKERILFVEERIIRFISEKKSK